MKTSIRRARSSDAACLTKIAHAAKRHWRYPEKLIRLWDAELTVTPESLSRQLVYCAVRGRRVVGFYALSGEGATYELEHMWVDPSHMGCGVGGELFRHLLERLRAMRARRLEIASDPNAEGFYRRMGARRIGRVPSKPSGRYLPLLVIQLRRSAKPSRRPERRPRPRRSSGWESHPPCGAGPARREHR